MRASDRSPGRPNDPFERLTPREHEVALLVAAGLPNAEIARQLGLSPSTVGTYIQHIKQRLELATRAEIAAWVHDGRSPDDPDRPTIRRPAHGGVARPPGPDLAVNAA